MAKATLFEFCKISYQQINHVSLSVKNFFKTVYSKHKILGRFCL